MYRIVVDSGQNLVEVTLGGMLDVTETAAYIRQLRHDMVVNRIHAPYRMVIDVSACPIQAQDMVQAMGEHMATMPKAGALAVVTGSSLARMQVRRLFKQSYARIVATVTDGRAWVLSGIEPPPETHAA